jgi:hypothetical protein
MMGSFIARLMARLKARSAVEAAGNGQRAMKGCG